MDVLLDEAGLPDNGIASNGLIHNDLLALAALDERQ